MATAHRGSNGKMKEFAPRFVAGRLAGFKKDIAICLTGARSETRSGLTHAYFPALMTCCSTLEYMAGLFVGRTDTSISRRDIVSYAARYMPQPDYDGEAVRLLVDAFRNAVAHRGIATGVWVDNHASHAGRRITWKVYEDDVRPALALRVEASALKQDSPWPCPYTHRMHIHVGSLASDILESASRYVEEMRASNVLLAKFELCMHRLYPRMP